MLQNNRVLLAARPRGEPKLDDFRFDGQPVPDPAVGESLLEVVFVSLDPYVRGRMNGGRSYAKTLEIGDVIEGRTVARVLASRNPDFAPGDWVLTAELLGRILRQRLTFRGFIVSDFADQQPAFERDMRRWIAEGRVKYREDIVKGLNACPQALIGLLRGANFGKQIARLCDE
jgi:NADPH-dependent curcumin reductase CurA